jgi:hypothetical protein
VHGFRHNRLDHDWDCPPWAWLHTVLGHLWPAPPWENSLDFFPNLGRNQGWNFCSLTDVASPQHSCFLGPSPLFLLLQGLCPVGFISHTSPLIFQNPYLWLCWARTPTGLPLLWETNQGQATHGETPGLAAAGSVPHRPPVMCLVHWAWTPLCFYHPVCNNVNQGSVGPHCSKNVNWGHCWSMLQQWPQITLQQSPCMSLLHLLYPWLPCWCHSPWCGMRNIFGVSVYSKEYTLPILLF